MIKRDNYLKKLINVRDNGFPKVITGVRRCGKSFLLKEIYKEYLISDGVKEENIIIIELDDDKNIKYRDPIMLGDYVRKLCDNNQKNYVFIDEIQKVYTIINPNLTNGKHVVAGQNDKEVVSFVDVILGLSRKDNIDLYVTGSNSKMLSSDIITEFRDKAINIYLAPLSFEEFFNYVKGNQTEAIYDYMQFGGMPLAVLKNTDEKKDYLKNLFEATYFRDIIERNDLRKGKSLEELCNVISIQTGELLNANKLANTYQSIKHEKIDSRTIGDYVRYFIDAFILREARRYDIKGRKEIGGLKKYYFVDTGLRNARLDFVFPDEGQMIENIVYNELMFNGYSVSVGGFDNVEKNKDGKSIRKTNEIDFYALKGNKKYYIQVTADISNKDTKEREIRPYYLVHDEVQKIVVVNKPIKETRLEGGFTIIGLTDFLLRFIK